MIFSYCFQSNRCKATVIQRSQNVFEFGENEHNHAAPVGAAVAAKIKSIIKQEASKDVFRPASAVVNDILLGELADAPCLSLPRVDSLQRTANRFREQLRPQDPKDLELHLKRFARGQMVCLCCVLSWFVHVTRQGDLKNVIIFLSVIEDIVLIEFIK